MNTSLCFTPLHVRPALNPGTFRERLGKRIHVLDGAMGTMIMEARLSEADFRGRRFECHPIALKGCNDILSITYPSLISEIHRSYLEAGADIISTNTFNSNALSLREFGLSEQAMEIAYEGARIARAAVDAFAMERRSGDDEYPLVAGSLGPTNTSLSISMQDSSDPARDFDVMAEAYREQASALIEGGVDLLLLETVFDTLNAKAAAYGILKAFRQKGHRVPVMVSATLTESGRLLSGQTLRQFVEALDHLDPISFGLNCGFGAQALIPHIQELNKLTQRFISIHPNAGLPDELGRYLDSPAQMANELRQLMEEDMVNIVGGCCGTTPEHIALIAHEAKRYIPRSVLLPSGERQGFQKSENGTFMKVGERCNVAGSRKFLRLVSERNWREALDIASDQLSKEAGMLDINMDDGLLDSAQTMRAFLLRLATDSRTSSVPLMIDSSDFDIISEALRLIPLKGAVNSISLKNGEEEFIARACEIHDLGCSMVVMAFDEQGQATTFDRRIHIIDRAYRLLTANGIPAEEIIFDPNVLAVATGMPEHDSYALDFIRTTQWIKANLPGVKVSGGISNLSFSFRGIDRIRKGMHSVFLEQNIKAGMDMAIINPTTPLDSEWMDPEEKKLIEDVILCREAGASDALIKHAMKVKESMVSNQIARQGDRVVSSKHSSSAPDARSRLSNALINGDCPNLEGMIGEALEECDGKAMSVINESLMKGMDRVGEQFGRGEIFLPQVIRSASVMKSAVDILTPLIEVQSESASGMESGRPVVVLATVKGDVHDIGKNIVGVVLRCSGFTVVDLGVMVTPERIIDESLTRGAVAIGLSGLITPSLHEMVEVARQMESRGMKIPLFIGGATTSELHTALKIAPQYSGPVVYTSDAASLAGALPKFIIAEAGEAVDELFQRQEQLRQSYISGCDSPVEEQISIDTTAYKCGQPAPTPLKVGDFTLEVPLIDLKDLINWRALLGEWKLPPSEVRSALSEDPGASEETRRLIGDTLSLLNDLKGSARVKVLIRKARSRGDDIIIERKEASEETGVGENELCLPTLRMQGTRPGSRPRLAMSDFVYEGGDHVGLFAVTLAGSGLPEEISRLREVDEYRSILLQSLSHRLAEAATEWMHRYVRRELWGIGERIGIRPAIGYASLPDQSLVFLLDEMLDYRSMGIEITEHGALFPSATTTGLILAHPESSYFEVGPVSENVLADYARRRGLPLSTLRHFLR